jgi:hypothetical protein
MPSEDFLLVQPRIYIYKVTFEDMPFWYWGVHKENVYGEIYLGSPKTNRQYWDFYTPQIQILQCFPYTEQGWKEAQLLEKRLIKPDLNNPLCLNEGCGCLLSYDSTSKGGKIGGKKGGKRIVELAVGIHDPENKELKQEWAREAAKKSHNEKDKDGKSLRASGQGKRTHQNGTGVFAPGNQARGGSTTGAQKFQCLVTGKVSTPGPLTLWQKTRGIDTSLRVRVG